MGIGDTIRVSLSADPVEEVKVGLRNPENPSACATVVLTLFQLPPAARASGFDVNQKPSEALERDGLEHTKHRIA